MKETALFYEDFLTMGENNKYIFNYMIKIGEAKMILLLKQPSIYIQYFNEDE